MENKQSYRIVQYGSKAVRRDYSKVSSELDLPDLVEIQTASFDWFMKEGIREVFEDIYPITNFGGNINLKFVDYEFGEPKYSISECKYREVNYCAPLKAKMELEVVDQETGEVMTKWEDVFLGDFPLMTPTGTFIINGAERVIVSQIVRSPGAYFDIVSEDRTGRDTYTCELIPSRGTWLEFMSDDKKAALGRIMNVSIDRKRKVFSTILLKSIGMALNSQKNDDAFETENMTKFLKAAGFDVYDDVTVEGEPREYLNDYMLLYTSVFGNYEEIRNTLAADKTRTAHDALLSVYENQRADEVPTLDGSISLMNAKFFDFRRYDLTKAGRYKLRKKLNVLDRMQGHALKEDLLGVDGKVLMRKGKIIGRDERNMLLPEMQKGISCRALPFYHDFSHPLEEDIDASWTEALVGRILATDLEGKTKKAHFEKGTVITAEDAKVITKEFKQVKIYTGIIASEVKVSAENIGAVLNLGARMFAIGRITDDGADLEGESGPLVQRYIPDTPVANLTAATRELITKQVKASDKVSVWLVGNCVQEVEVLAADGHAVKVIGIDPLNSKKCITMTDMYALYSYELNMLDGIGTADDIDMLGNRRIRTVGELIQNQFRIGLSRMERVVKERMSITEVASLTPKQLTNIRPLTAAIKEFFSSSQLSQFMDQQNPLAELSNKRRISALGPGGLTRERAGFEVRDIHNSHYGRICPIETPEGPNIGLISYLTTYARINEYGFLQTPYRKVEKGGVVTDEVVYMSADEEYDHVIAQANEIHDGRITNSQVVARIAGDTVLVNRADVDYADVSPKQIVSVATACVPFLENDDCTRALMGANMQRQAVPLLNPHSPYVGTGIEHRIARDSGAACVATADGVVTYVDATKVVVKEKDAEHEYDLTKFRRSNASTCLNQRPIVVDGEKVKRGDILADGPSMQNGELALGQNVTIAFMTWHGYNYEDAIIMSERMVREDVYTSVHIEEYDIECRETKLGPEEITRDIPNVAESACRNLDARGIVMVGAEVKEGDILVGKVTPKGQSEISPEEKLLLAIFGEKSREVRDNSLKVPHGGAGIVQSIRIFKRKDSELPPGVNEIVKVYIVQKRKISEGDKMAGRHGNKGVISKILPIEDMPYMDNGQPVDLMLNPFGVPSRMNIGQVLELHLGMAAKSLGVKFATPVFDGIGNDELKNIMAEAKTSPDGKMVLHDGMTGDPYDERIAVGVMYMIKLAHMVDDKLHARATGPYSLVTQQPLGGKAQNGGQRFGEMEVWALEAYGAAHTLQEILTVKSDDIMGRTKTYEAIVKGKDIPEPGIPESFRVLQHELQALAIDVKMLDENGTEVDMKKIEQEELKEETSFDISKMPTLVNDTEGLTIKNDLDEEVPEAAEVGFDDEDSGDKE